RLSPNTFHFEPVVFRRAVVAQQRRGFIHIDDDYVDVAVVVEVSESRTAAGARLRYHCARLGSDVGKTSIPEVSIQDLPLLKRKVQLLGVDLRETWPFDINMSGHPSLSKSNRPTPHPRYLVLPPRPPCSTAS